MIDLKLLTPENGFQDGVVVEIKYIGIGKRYLDILYKTEFDQWETQEDITNRFHVIKSIRPLTGPMAIWNFAPKWASRCMIGSHGVVWADDNSGLSGYGVINRPWWAKDGE